MVLTVICVIPAIETLLDKKISAIETLLENNKISAIETLLAEQEDTCNRAPYSRITRYLQ